MVNYQVRVVVCLVALLGAQEIKGFSMWSSETALTTLQIGVFLSGINYYCYGIKLARQEEAVEDESITNKSTVMELEKDDAKISKMNTNYGSDLKANVKAVEQSIRSSKQEQASIDRKEQQKIEATESIGPDYRTLVSDSNSEARKKTVRNSKEVRKYKKK
uniref:Uncharacterized protein n=1 Tax=Glossina brevipalpis TaxID=37001 RepID=A0A1A9W6V9_9MUSC